MGVFRRKNRRKRSLRHRLGEVGASVLTAAHLTLRVVVTVLVVLALPVGIYYSYHALMRSNYFVITTIQLEGNERVDRGEILALAGLDQPKNILTVDPQRIERQLLANPWIVWAQVERELPRTIRIAIQERQRAGWLFYRELYQVDSEGLVIETGRAGEVDGPLITGIDPASPQEDGGIQQARVRMALQLMQWYRARELNDFDELAEVHLDELLGFSLLTRDHVMEIRIGDDQFEQRLDRLVDVFVTMEGEPLLGRYILLDGEDALTRVAVGPVRPGRGGGGPSEDVTPR